VAGDPVTTRLNWACGPELPEGWINSDETRYVQVPPWLSPDHLGRIQDGLPWPAGHFDYVVAHHALMMLPEVDLVPALVELRRVTTPGGWLRVSVPDMVAAVNALRADDLTWFPVAAGDTDTAFCLYVTQGGATRSVFTFRRLYRLLVLAGWQGPRGSSWRATWSPHEGITDLDSRPNESLFMEAQA
jgi:SAM-dependent methyltransferase